MTGTSSLLVSRYGVKSRVPTSVSCFSVNTVLMSIPIRSGSGAEWAPKQRVETSSMKNARQFLRIEPTFLGCVLHKIIMYKQTNK